MQKKRKLKSKLESIHLQLKIVRLNYSMIKTYIAEKKKKFKPKNEYLMFSFLLVCEEWGDKSQFSAIALAANYGITPILIGGSLVISFL